MDGKFGKDLTVGSIPRHLLSFSAPMLIGNLIQTAYSLVNAVWVGNIVGANAMGAITISFQVMFIMIAIASGATMATTILVSQYYGAKDLKMVEKVVNNSFSITLILGVILTMTGLLTTNFILLLMDTPREIFSMASGYMKISFAGFTIMYFAFLIPSILRGIGDTVTPLIFQAIGIGINAILDPLLIIGVGPLPKLGLNGAAYASLIAQTLALSMALVYFNRKRHIVAINPKNFTLDKQLTFLTFKLGFPSIIQQSLVSIGSAFITAFVNAFGASAIAAYGAASRIDGVAFMPAMSLGMAASAITGQNLGAKKPERVKEIFKWGIIMTSAITLIISIFAVSIPRILLSMFTQDKIVLDIGATYLRIEGASYILFAVMFVSNGVINGAGHTFTTMLFSLVSLWVVRVPLSAILSRTQMGLTGIWTAIVISFGVVMTVSLVYYFSGRWKKEVIRPGMTQRDEKKEPLRVSACNSTNASQIASFRESDGDCTPPD